jgi:short-subunit dehydrogenase
MYSKLSEMNPDLSSRRVWITGASSGIGEQLAYACARRGAALILSARNKEALEQVKSRCEGAKEVTVLPVDLASVQSIEQAVSRVRSEAKVPDILIHNGGRSQRSFALDTPMEIDRSLMEVNYFGPVELTKRIVPDMLKNGGGQLIVMSSLAGKWGFYERSAYAASKHALHGFFETLRLENESKGLRVALVTPGFIATDISKHAVDARGNASGEMDPNQAKGMPADKCAELILKNALAGKEEFGVGGKELNALWIHRYFPKLFGSIIRKQSPR